MRDRNCVTHFGLLWEKQVCILPMRDRNVGSAVTTFEMSVSFVSYLWGIETFLCRHFRRMNYGWVCILPMRDRNSLLFIYLPSIFSTFVSYLWGIETRRSIPHHLSRGMFVSYLWGIETPSISSIDTVLAKFVSYLWGIETIFSIYSSCFSSVFVSYLWGIETWSNRALQRARREGRLYLTYEGSKRSSHFIPWYIFWSVCILPMRDRNM